SKRVLTWSLQDRTPKDLARLEKAIRVKIQGYSGDGRILACGPEPFLRMVSRLSREYEARTQISIERPMACGHGVCLACSVNGAGGETYRACVHGPVFSAEQLALDEQS
ncbi:MAG: dihydroorotate dehydrogenase electron transfer subunit, partial [Desulfohalobiaceae bacterium]|nr:dihydroorotate dehydrogenase electron transfer subunit [Desulfohalobiaceae bacterium]